HGVALARLGRHVPARSAFLRAQETAELAGDREDAGLASISLIEELGNELSFEELRVAYERGDALLSESQHPEILMRLRRAAAKVFATDSLRNKEKSETGPAMLAVVNETQRSDKQTWENFSLKEEVRR